MMLMFSRTGGLYSQETLEYVLAERVRREGQPETTAWNPDLSQSATYYCTCKHYTASLSHP
jgi:hypothetical protein